LKESRCKEATLSFHIKGSSSTSPIRLPLVRHRGANTLHILRIPLTRALQQRVLGIFTIPNEEPCAAGPRVLIRCDDVSNRIALLGRQAVDARRGGDLPHGVRLHLERVGKVVLCHLHVACALARRAGEVVDVVLEVTGLKGDERQHGGDGGRVVDTVGLEGLWEEAGGLRGGAAFVWDGGAVAGFGVWRDGFEDGGCREDISSFDVRRDGRGKCKA